MNLFTQFIVVQTVVNTGNVITDAFIAKSCSHHCYDTALIVMLFHVFVLIAVASCSRLVMLLNIFHSLAWLFLFDSGFDNKFDKEFLIVTEMAGFLTIFLFYIKVVYTEIRRPYV